MFKWTKSTKAIAIGFAVAATCGAARADIEAVAILPLSGASQVLGLPAQAGMKVYQDEINAKGGVTVNGKKEKLNLRFLDDKGDAETAAALTKDALAKGVTIFFNNCNSANGLKSNPLINEAKAVNIVACASGSALTRQFAKDPAGNYIFRVSADDGLQARVVMAELARQGHSKIALISDETAYGKSGLDELSRAAKDLGISIVFQSVFKIGDSIENQAAIGKMISDASKSGAKAYVAWGLTRELAIIAKARETVGIKAPFYAGWTAGTSDLPARAGAAADGFHAPTTFVEDAPKNERQAQFLAKARKAYGKDRLDSPSSAAQGYDAVGLGMAAVEQAGSVDGPKVKAALEALAVPFQGVIQVYRKPFTETNHESQDYRSLKMAVVKDGKLALDN